MRTHELKTWPEYYSEVEAGRKTFEVRVNDRDYQIGDILRLQEYDPATHNYTGKTTDRRVTYILRNFPVLAPDFVIMAIEPLASP